MATNDRQLNLLTFDDQPGRLTDRAQILASVFLTHINVALTTQIIKKNNIISDISSGYNNTIYLLLFEEVSS